MEGLDDVTVGGFNLLGLLLAFALISLFFFVMYWMWDCSCRQSDEMEDRGSYCSNSPHINQQSPVVPLYAFELEPGTVVLQSADGEIFRILREYDSVGRTGRGSPPLYESVATTSAAQEFHYVPSYTRAHFQTHPSAPADAAESGSAGNGFYTHHTGADEAFGANEPWAPLYTRRN